MNKTERMNQLVKILTCADGPVAGTRLAKELHVTRPVIVQDIAMLRANNMDIISTNRGYLLRKPSCPSRVFKNIHTNEMAEDELKLIVDIGGRIKDEFVYHKAYGVVKVDMNIHSRYDIKKYMENIASGKSSPLLNVTSGYHYHTVEADSNEQLDLIEEELRNQGFLAKLQEFEPIDFWEQARA